MHTSTLLTAADFEYAAGPAPRRFEDFCPDYHTQDRLGVVCVDPIQALQGVAYALLACTTAFYDSLRARSGRNSGAAAESFFDYPQHFVVFAQHGAVLDAGQTAPWSNLDVWPACKWHTAAPTAADMMRWLFDFQINRVFWPARFSLPALQPGATLPTYIRDTLGTHLKSVHRYGGSQPTITIRPGPGALAVGIKSAGPPANPLESHRLQDPRAFLLEYAEVFGG